MITSVKQSDVTVLRTFKTPNVCVRNTIAATVLLLGHYDMQKVPYRLTSSLLNVRGRDSLIKRMEDLNPDTVPLEAALGARLLMEKFGESQVLMACAAAMSLFHWNQAVIEAVLAKYGEEEIANTEPRT